MLKVGDKVRRINSSNTKFKVGEVRKVIELSKECCLFVRVEGSPAWNDPENLELVTNATKNKYQTKPIDFTDCDPVVAEHLKRGEAVLCDLEDDPLPRYVLGYIADYEYPYMTIIEGELEGEPSEAEHWKTAKPIPQKATYVKKASEIVKWLEDNGFRIRYDGAWVHDNLDMVRSSFLFRCDKPVTDNEHEYEPEWLEER